ncbi:MAG: zinc ABC transporter substrate-binding protein [Candidatus Iainarchaeum archaeon]|uniref:Zinc ABC transporter substrate-binding protein n=1 Tax=Candidatus Iainarchaeum sp. TaxID=3101447 RepID=A0A7T9I1E3_9ARCH|nr:MAG: zinc ABC transporter substrate-binding protein [Candidatus Diapherotrites archaeon]
MPFYSLPVWVGSHKQFSNSLCEKSQIFFKMQAGLNKMKWFVAIGLIAVIVAMGCISNPQPTGQNHSMAIATTFFPLQDLTKKIVGDTAEVFSIVPSGIEPHDYEPSPQEFVSFQNARAFITMGLEFEHLEGEFIESRSAPITVIHAEKGIVLLDGDEEHEHEHEEEHMEEHAHEEEHEEEHTGKDPHIWLSPKNMQVMAQNISAGLMNAFPDNATLYEQNTQQLIANLMQLDQEYAQGLSQCNKDIVLVSHNAFSYLANDYGFQTIHISGLEPESEPTPDQIRELVDAAKEHDLKYIFYEELVDPRVSNAIAQEVGAQTLELNPAEGSSNPDEDYFSIMRENLNHLKLALECS